nr:hypothetical protein [Micromonospora sp. DSM 115978]
MIQRTLTGDPLLNPVGRFTGSLAAWRDPSYLAPLGHATGPDEPAGLLSGLATPAPPEPAPPGPAEPAPGTANAWSATTGPEPAGPLAAPATQPAPVTVSRLITAPPAPVMLRLPTIETPAPPLAGPSGGPPASPPPDGAPTLGADPLDSTVAGHAGPPAPAVSPDPADDLASTDPATAGLLAATGAPGPPADPVGGAGLPGVAVPDGDTVQRSAGAAGPPVTGATPRTSTPGRRLGLGEPIVPPLASAPSEPGWQPGPLPVSRLTIPPAGTTGSAIPDPATGRPAPPSTDNPIGYAHPPARPTPTGPVRPADLTGGPDRTVEPAHRDGPDLPPAPPTPTVARSTGAAPADLPRTDRSPNDLPPVDPSPVDPPGGANAGPEPSPADQDGWSADAGIRPTNGAEPVPLASVDWSTGGSPDGLDRPDAGDGPPVGSGHGPGDGGPTSPLLGDAPPVGGAPAVTTSLAATPMDTTADITVLGATPVDATAGVTVARTAAGDQSPGAAAGGQVGGPVRDPAAGPDAGLPLLARRVTDPERPRPGGTGAAVPIVVARLIGDRPPVTRLGHPADRRPATGPPVQRLTWDRPADGRGGDGGGGGGGGAADFITATDSPNQPDINGRHDVFGTASRAVANQVGVVGTPAEAGGPLAASWPAGGNRPARSGTPTTLDGLGPGAVVPDAPPPTRAPALTVARSTATPTEPAGDREGAPFSVPLAFSWVGSVGAGATADAVATGAPQPARAVQRAEPAPEPSEAPPGPVELSTGPQPEPPPASTGNAPQPSAAPAAVPGAAVEPDELLKKLFDPLLRRIKTELRLDRERHGLSGGVG